MEGAWKPNWGMPAGSGDLWPEAYEQGRPGWPRQVLSVGGVPSSATVLELAAGTGKLTRLLLTGFERVVAVEPADAMRRVLVRQCPSAEVKTGSAESIPFSDAAVDAVYVAEAFTHFDRARAVTEIARVLRPGGVLVLMWNLPAGPWEPCITAVEHLLDSRVAKLGALSYDPLDLGGTQYRSMAWMQVFEASRFGMLHEVRFPNPQSVDRDALVAFLASMGWVASLPDDERLPLLEQVTALLTAREYRRLWESHVHWARLRGT